MARIRPPYADLEVIEARERSIRLYARCLREFQSLARIKKEDLNDHQETRMFVLSRLIKGGEKKLEGVSISSDLVALRQELQSAIDSASPQG